MRDIESEPKPPYFTPEVRRWTKIIGGGLAVLALGGLVSKIVYDNYQHDKDVLNATAQGYLKGLGFDANKLPIEVTDGAKILRISCDASENGAETITSPHVAFHLDDKVDAYLVMPPLSDPDNQTYGDETITEYPLQTAEDVDTFIGGALVDLCSNQN